MNALIKNTYLVGGAVRDQLLDICAKDKDYVVVGVTVKQMEALGFEAVGADFPVFLHPKTKDEYALARTERKTGQGYTGFEVDASTQVTLEEDLARRDLTINAMALDNQGQIIDPYHGREDLANKILKHTTEAFVEDPVRVLRVARFLARYGDQWQIHPDTLALIYKMKDSGELSHLVAERVWKETEKALSEPYPHLYFMALNGLGIFPEIEQMMGVPQPKQYHPEGDVFVHTMLVLKQAADLGFDIETRFAALTHDFGKASCYQQNQNLYGHEQIGVAVIESFCQRIKIPNRFTTLAKLVSDNHTRCHKIFELTPKTLHKLIIENLNGLNHPIRFEQFLRACQCDAQGRGKTLVDKPYRQSQFATQILNALQQLDKKSVVQNAIAHGKKGAEIGASVKQAEIACIKDFLAEYKARS